MLDSFSCLNHPIYTCYGGKRQNVAMFDVNVDDVG